MSDQPFLRAAWFGAAAFAAVTTWWAWPSLDSLIYGGFIAFYLYEGVFW